MVNNEAPPFPISEENVSMELLVDKRSRESPDSILKSESKSLKTFGVATTTNAKCGVSCACAQLLLELMNVTLMSESPQLGSSFFFAWFD